MTLPWPQFGQQGAVLHALHILSDASSPHTSSLGGAAGLVIGHAEAGLVISQAEGWRIKELRGHYPGAHAAHLSCHCQSVGRRQSRALRTHAGGSGQLSKESRTARSETALNWALQGVVIRSAIQACCLT